MIRLTEEEYEMLISLLEQDRVQYDGVTNQYELDMVEQYNTLILKLKILKNLTYGN